MSKCELCSSRCTGRFCQDCELAERHSTRGVHESLVPDEEGEDDD